LPQCFGSLLRFVSQPVCSLLSQSPKPGLQLASLHVPPLHVDMPFAATHSPHASVVPQPDEAWPHVKLSDAHVLARQPHWLACPVPPHTAGGAHEPQSRTSLHPSETDPHEAPTSTQVLGVQTALPHLFCPPPPHVAPDA